MIEPRFYPAAIVGTEPTDYGVLAGPHPKSLSHGERDFEESSGPPLPPGRGAGGEGCETGADPLLMFCDGSLA